METKNDNIDLSVIMPCLNEENTVAQCVSEAWNFIEENNLCGEVIVVDNGSEDKSAEQAARAGAMVLKNSVKGYGSAIKTGIAAGRGHVLVIGDCDTTYDFFDIKDIYEMLSNGQYDMVIGDRYAGGMEKGSMPLSHKIGVRILSFLGREKFHTDIYDFHCGLRGMTDNTAKKLNFTTNGMEFATEMIAIASLNGLKIGQTPVKLRKCLKDRKSKLRTIKDGIRHLRYILSYKVYKGENDEYTN